MDMKNNIIYYAELKSNLNLDTEKSSETVKKCLKIKGILIENYPSYEIKMFLVGVRHLATNTIRKNVKNKYNEISDNLVGINEYLTTFVPQQKEFKNEENYKVLINKIVKMLKLHN